MKKIVDKFTEEVFSKVENILGWMGNADCYTLIDYARIIKHGLILEIGTYAGRSAYLFALASPSSTVVTIDPYLKSFPKSSEASIMFKKEMAGNRIVQIKNSSSVAASTWVAPIDLLHIDGSHEYSRVEEDIRLYSPFVKSGHYVLLHDAVSDYARGINRAVNDTKDEFFDEVKIVSGFVVCRKI
jgi:predicted O-methyltransferase YrrM